MKDIAIYGAGGFGREVACLINEINKVSPMWNIIGFFDDGIEKGIKNEYGKVLGGINEINAWSKPLDIAIAIGSPRILNLLSEKITNPNVSFPNIIAPNTIWLDKWNVAMGKGNIVCNGCLFSCNTKIGDFNQFNSFITIGHDSTIGNCNSFMPGVRISGDVSIGDYNFWGFNSGILQQKKVGNNVTVGAGSIIMRRPKDGNTYIGIPATIIKY